MVCHITVTQLKSLLVTCMAAAEKVYAVCSLAADSGAQQEHQLAGRFLS
jgi:hypothetical protein